MKKIGLLFILLSVIFVTACTTGPSCTNDGFCNVDEQFVGNCADCRPDFAILEDAQDAYYYAQDNSIEARVCVANKNSNYDGNVDTQWFVYSDKQNELDRQTERVYFSSSQLETDAELEIKNKQLRFDTYTFFGDREETNCFYKTFYNLAPSSEYYVSFNINPSQDVEEMNYDNNYAGIWVEGVEEHYPEILIEQNFGDIEYISSRLYANAQDHDYDFDRYIAFYEGKKGDEYMALVTISDSEKSAQELMDIVVENWANNGINSTDIALSNNKTVKYMVQDNDEAWYVWKNSEKLLIVAVEDSMNSAYKATSNPLALAYTDKYPPAHTTTTPTATSGKNTQS